MPVRICLIFNPTARGDKARRLQRHLDEIGRECTLKRTDSAGAARRLAAEAVREGFDVVVAAGGDGTLNEAVNGIAEEPGGLERVRLGVLPLGTANVFAREFGIPFDLERAWRAIRDGVDTEIDLPRAELDVRGETEVLRFAQLAGCGLDARAVELVDYGLKKKVGPLAYVYAGVKAFLGPLARITVETDGRSLAGELVLIGNGRLYGGEYPIFHRADPADGLLDARVFSRIDWDALGSAGWAWLAGNWENIADAEYLQAREIRLSSEDWAPFEVDGEFVGAAPAVVGMDGSRLKVIVPKRTG